MDEDYYYDSFLSDGDQIDDSDLISDELFYKTEWIYTVLDHALDTYNDMLRHFPYMFLNISSTGFNDFLIFSKLKNKNFLHMQKRYNTCVVVDKYYSRWCLEFKKELLNIHYLISKITPCLSYDLHDFLYLYSTNKIYI